MPSGAKKRKAAKKKKGNQSSNNPNPSSASTHSRGGDDVKHRDDKESDAGEVSSPASQDHHSHQNLLTEGEEEDIEERENISKKIEVVGEPNEEGEENVVPVEGGFKIEYESNKKDGTFEHDEAARKSYDGGPSGSSSSSSNSSDDESHGIKNRQAVMDIAPIVDSVKLADSSSGRQASDLVLENIPDVTSEKISLSGVKAESLFQENVEEEPSFVEDKVVISEAFKNSASHQEEAIIQSAQSIAPVSDSEECLAQETDERLIVSYNAPIATADNGAADTEKDSGVTQPLLAPAPRPVETTSWKSCCGLFDIFTGSGR